jgi:hypothetical protein
LVIEVFHISALFCLPASGLPGAQTKEYGDEDLLGFGYPQGVDPKPGA